MLKGFLMSLKMYSSFIGGDMMICNIENLEAHSFTQLGEYTEYVCVNVADRTDFIIFEDKNNDVRINSKVQVELNSMNAVRNYEVLIK